MVSSKQLNITPVILAGGAGKRLRPLTSPTRPKPFLRFLSKNSLFQDTLQRADYFAPPVVTCAAPFANNVFEQYYEVGLTPQAVICEPAQRGTAAAIAAAALFLKGKTEYMLVMPSDHYISDDAVFADIVRSAAQVPEDFVLLAAKPSEASTRYGYIMTDGKGKLVQFIEKPMRAVALDLFVRKNTYWNTGIFLCRPHAYLDQLQHFEPLIHKRVVDAMAQKTLQGNFVFPAADPYADIPAKAVDHAVMERLREEGVVTLQTEWHDLGTLGSLFSLKFDQFLRWFEGYNSSRKA